MVRDFELRVGRWQSLLANVSFDQPVLPSSRSMYALRDEYSYEVICKYIYKHIPIYIYNIGKYFRELKVG